MQLKQIGERLKFRPKTLIPAATNTDLHAGKNYLNFISLLIRHYVGSSKWTEVTFLRVLRFLHHGNLRDAIEMHNSIYFLKYRTGRHQIYVTVTYQQHPTCVSRTI
jgi:hypothetical protein